MGSPTFNGWIAKIVDIHFRPGEVVLRWHGPDGQVYGDDFDYSYLPSSKIEVLRPLTWASRELLKAVKRG